MALSRMRESILGNRRPATGAANVNVMVQTVIISAIALTGEPMPSDTALKKFDPPMRMSSIDPAEMNAQATTISQGYTFCFIPTSLPQ